MTPMASRSDRSRKWTSILYEESASENWERQLEDLLIPIVVSPRHDKDLDESGQLKKPHWHVLYLYDGLQRFEHVRKISQDLLHGTIPQKVQSERSMVRYFIHADQPEKHQYDRADIITLNGAEVGKWFDGKPSSEVFYAILTFARDSDINEIADLYDVVDANKNDPEFGEWRSFLSTNHQAQAIDRYLRSRRWRLQNVTKRNQKDA